MLQYSQWLGQSVHSKEIVAILYPKPTGATRSNIPSQPLTGWDGLTGKNANVEAKLSTEHARLIERYYVEVANREKIKLPLGPRIKFDEEFTSLRHGKRDVGSSFTKVRDALDAFACRWSGYIQNGFDMAVVSGKPIHRVHIQSGTADIGWIDLRGATHDVRHMPWIGGGSQNLMDLPAGSDIKRPQKLRVNGESIASFFFGAPGTAWVGLCLIGQRLGLNESIIYLFPNNPMRTHLTNVHVRKASYPLPVITHGGSPGHAVASTHLVRNGMLPPGVWHWHGHRPGRGPYENDLQEYGVVFGFSMAKGDSEAGHYWNFTSMSCNNYATAEWREYKAGKEVRIIPGLTGDGAETSPAAAKKVAPAPPKAPAKKEFNNRFTYSALKGPQVNIQSGAVHAYEEHKRVDGMYWIKKGDTNVPKEWAAAIWKATEGLR